MAQRVQYVQLGGDAEAMTTAIQTAIAQAQLDGGKVFGSLTLVVETEEEIQDPTATGAEEH